MKPTVESSVSLERITDNVVADDSFGPPLYSVGGSTGAKCQTATTAVPLSCYVPPAREAVQIS